MPGVSWRGARSLIVATTVAIVFLFASAPAAGQQATSQLWLVIFAPTQVYWPSDDPAWIAQPGEWYQVLRLETGWVLAVWELDSSYGPVWIETTTGVQLSRVVLRPPPPPTARPTPRPPATPVPPISTTPIQPAVCVSYDVYGNCISYSGGGVGTTCVSRDINGNCITYSGSGVGTTAVSAGPVFRGQAPVYCETAPVAGVMVYGCSYPDQSFAAWRSPGPPWILLASILPGSTATFTAEGNALWGLQPLPSVGSQLPNLSVPSRGLLPPRTPDDSDLVVTGSVSTLVSRSFPVINGRACNNAVGWMATGIRIEFVFYYDSLLPTLDSGSHYITEIRSGECRSFTASLTALQPWRRIVIGRVSGTWEPER